MEPQKIATVNTVFPKELTATVRVQGFEKNQIVRNKERKM